MNMKKLFVILVLIGAIGVAQAQKVRKIDFPTFQKELKAHTDSLVLYNFWATWCRPCIKELPYFQQVHKDYADKKVKVVFVSLDFPDQLKTLVEPFVKKKNIQAEVWLLDAPNYNDWIDKISPDWTGSIPATLANMPSKKIYKFKEAAFTQEELTAWVEELLE